MFAFVFDGSLFEFTLATPPFGFALLFERLTTREPLPVSTLFFCSVCCCVTATKRVRFGASRGLPLHPTLYVFTLRARPCRPQPIPLP